MKPNWNISENSRVAVLGLGRSGRAACQLLARHGAKVTALDSGTGSVLEEAVAGLRQSGVDCRIGGEATCGASEFDLAVLSPGIDPAVPMVDDFRQAGVEIISEVELAWRACDSTVVAVTGTNGKTTTTSLTAHLLANLGHSAVACGNIGAPFSEVLLEKPDTEIFLIEVSSFQLEACSSFRPKVAVWTNFSPNHLDRYVSVDEYFEAKARIFSHQEKDDFAVVQLGARLPDIPSQPIRFSATVATGDFSLRGTEIVFHGQTILDQSTTHLGGPHNAENLMAAFGVLHALGIDPAKAAAAARTFLPPEHRCEVVVERNGILFLNDSKSTTLDSLEKALNAQTRPVILIAGGKDKGFSFAPLAGLVREKVTHAVLIGEMRSRIASDWTGVRCPEAESLEEAVSKAADLAPPGAVVLFSPGTSSFDMFRNYEERGTAFKNIVLSLAQPPTKPQNQTNEP